MENQITTSHNPKGQVNKYGSTALEIGLQTKESIDWEGKYVFFPDGSVDPHQSHQNGVLKVDMQTRPLPTINDEKRKNLLETKTALQNALRPANKNEFATIITKLSMHCGMQKTADGAVRSILDDYFTDFGDYPKILIEEACRKWRIKSNGNEWMPKSSDFISMMFSDRYFLTKILKRTKILLGEPVENPKKVENGMKSLSELLKIAN